MRLRSGQSVSTKPNAVQKLETTKTVSAQMKKNEGRTKTEKLKSDVDPIEEPTEPDHMIYKKAMTSLDNFIDNPKAPKAKQVKKDITVHELYLQFKPCFDKQPKGLIESVVNFGELFDIILQNFDKLKSYDKVINIIRIKIDHWREEVPKKTLARVLNNTLGDTETAFAAIQKSDAVVEAVAKKLGYPKQK